MSNFDQTHQVLRDAVKTSVSAYVRADFLPEILKGLEMGLAEVLINSDEEQEWHDELVTVYRVVKGLNAIK